MSFEDAEYYEQNNPLLKSKEELVEDSRKLKALFLKEYAELRNKYLKFGLIIDEKPSINYNGRIFFNFIQ
jgi:hypothetical protein